MDPAMYWQNADQEFPADSEHLFVIHCAAPFPQQDDPFLRPASGATASSAMFRAT
jgi:hypothetical protein